MLVFADVAAGINCVFDLVVALLLLLVFFPLLLFTFVLIVGEEIDEDFFCPAFDVDDWRNRIVDVDDGILLLDPGAIIDVVGW